MVSLQKPDNCAQTDQQSNQDRHDRRNIDDILHHPGSLKRNVAAEDRDADNDSPLLPRRSQPVLVERLHAVNHDICGTHQ